MASKNSAKRTTKPSLPKKGEKRPFTWRKRPQLEGERPPEIEIVFFMLEGRAPTLPSTLRVHMEIEIIWK